ncbi:MAG: hypothetical protein JNM17_08455 [Archangium sp.]|nr:hypothetical protein [Archangium sp.]
MFRLSLVLAAVALMVLTMGCPNPPPPDAGVGGGRGGGNGGGTGGGIAPFTVEFLDENARDAVYHAMALDPATERVGVVYLTPAGTEMNQGHPDYFIKYVEWRAGAIVVPPETIRTVQRFVGLSIAFDPISGDPFVAHLGGAPGFTPPDSIFWFQSDASLSRRSNGTWTETIVATSGDQVTCGNPVSDRGFLVGLWPAIVFDSTGRMYYGYRDGHGGQFPMQDWAGTDVEIWEGNAPPTTGRCAANGGNNKDAYGGHLRMVIAADDQPAIIHDQMFGTADTNGINTIFQRRLMNGNWTPPSGSLVANPNTQSGASLAWDPMEGYGIAFIERTSSRLGYISSADGVTFNAVDPVFGSGSGGWYPSLAMDPINHEPAIAFYVCSTRTSVNEQSCNITEDELRVTQRISGNWRETLVDTEGGFTPQLGFFTSPGRNGKRVIVYRMPPSVDPGTGLTVTNVGQLKIAVER